MVKPGTYKANILSHAITETSKGDPQAVISFSFESDGSSHQINWYGSFSEKAMPHTLKALLVAGLKGNNPAGELEIGREVLIVIENDTDQEGKERNKVRWVNAINSVKNVMPQDQAKAKLAALEGQVMMARQKLKIQDDDIIPF